MDESLSDVSIRLDAIERELCVLKARLASLSRGRSYARAAAERFLALRDEVKPEKRRVLSRLEAEMRAHTEKVKALGVKGPRLGDLYESYLEMEFERLPSGC